MSLKPVQFAFDRQSARSRDTDGRMRVKNCVLSTAEVNPYRGDEIPKWQELGLDPNKIYELYRAPDEMRKAAETANGPLFVKHIVQTAEEPRKEYVAGSVYNVSFDGKHLRGDLLIGDGRAIDLVESDEQSDLSCGYRYRADMTSGVAPNGQRYDGVMRDLEFNHTALVDEGRATGAHVADNALPRFNPTGPDPTMQNSEDNSMENENDIKARDAELPANEPGNVGAQAGMADVGAALKEIAALLKDIHGATCAAPEAPEASEPAAPEGAEDESEEDPEGAEDFDLEKGPKEGAFDDDIEEGDGEGAEDEELDYGEPGKAPKAAPQEGLGARGLPTPHGAMDAATLVKRAVAAERRRAAGVEAAKRDVRGVLGDVFGMDNAGAIYREALRAEGVDTRSIPKGMAKLAWHTHVNAKARTLGARPQSDMAMDADVVGKRQSSLLANISKIRSL